MRPLPAEVRGLVVGTTADYIDWLRRRRPGRALFLTDLRERRRVREQGPAPQEEIVCDLNDPADVRWRLEQYLANHRITLEGVLAFDCEAMALTAEIASAYSLPYPTPRSIADCRNKARAIQLWRHHRLAVPRSQQVASPGEAVRFLIRHGGPCVLKPVNGSGSELIFRCDSTVDCQRRFGEIRHGLDRRRRHPLYASQNHAESPLVIETLIEGTEYSCDFAIADDRVTPIRLTRKIMAHHLGFGTVGAYCLGPVRPSEIDAAKFERTLYQAARAIGITRAICMLDFIVHQGRMVLLELAPRPGGDCLPWLLRRACNLDILALLLDFSCRRTVSIPSCADSDNLIAVRLYAPHGGIIGEMDTTRIKNDRRVQEIHLIRNPGHRITMPPGDYDSRILGHLIFKPNSESDLEQQCWDVISKFVVRMELV